MMKLVELAYFTDNIETMENFYRNLLGVEPVARSDDMAIFMSGQMKIFIHCKYVSEEGELPADDHIAFAVENAEATYERLIKQGLTLEVPPQDYYWGRSAYLRDPDGHMVEITKT
jgi:catechol 2,3-dioxygenase-like lactoylglutathione lyase family enzyme